MINASKEFREAAEKNTAFWVTANAVLHDGTRLTLEKKDFYLAGNGIVDSSDSSEFPLGAAVEKTCTLALVNDKDQFSEYDFGNAQFAVFLNLQLSDRTEIIKRGTFVVVKKPTTGEKINLTLADHMYKADVSYTSNLTFPATALEVLQDSCLTCGIMLGDATFNNADFVITEKPTNTTHRAVIGNIAMLAGGNARIDEDDRLRILNFDRNALKNSNFDGGIMSPWSNDTSFDGGTMSPWTEGDELDGGTFDDWTAPQKFHIIKRIKNLQFDMDEATITGVKTVVDEQEYLYGENGYAITIENPLISGKEEEALQRIGDVIIGLSMRSFSCQSIAMPTATFMDPAIVVDRKGRHYPTYLTNVDFLFGGYTTVGNSIPDVAMQSSEYPSAGSAAVEQAKKEVEKKLSAYDIAVQNMNQLSANTLGFYYTMESQPDGSVIAYMHDKPTLAESIVIYKKGIDGFFVSQDGGKTYNVGYDKNGNAVLNILYAIGIQAEWINTRGMSAKDNDGNITFRVNADDGSVDIIANTFRLRGKTIEEIAKEQVGEITIPNYYGSYTPTLNNQPASSWKAEEYASHDGSIFMDFLNHKIYVFKASGTSGAWEELENEAVVDFETVFNALTNNGEWDGIFMENGHLYINTSYLHGDQISADLINLKNVSVTDANGNTTFAIDQYGNVSIRANSFSLSGNTIQSIANSAASSYANSALSAAKNYTDQQLADFDPDVNLTQQEIFNILTNNGQTQGIYLSNEKIYINASYIDTGVLAGWTINSAAKTISCKVDKNKVVLDASNGRIYVESDDSQYDSYVGTRYGTLLQGFKIETCQVDSMDVTTTSLTTRSGADIGGSLDVGGDITVSGAVKPSSTSYFENNHIKIYAYGMISTANFEVQIGGSSTSRSLSVTMQGLNSTSSGNTMVLDSNSKICRMSSSSKRYKNHVRDVELQDVDALYDLPVVFFQYKEGYLDKNDLFCGQDVPGIYAEDMEKYYPKAVRYIKKKDITFPRKISDSDELIPDDWEARYLIPAMLKLIQSQKDQIDSLEARLARLEQLIGGGA